MLKYMYKEKFILVEKKKKVSREGCKKISQSPTAQLNETFESFPF